MSNYTPSILQQNILNAVNNTKGNIIIDAKAGSGKTTTLLLITNELEKEGKDDYYFTSFNRNIVDEIISKIPHHEKYISTVNALGHKFLSSYCCSRHKFDYKLTIENTKYRKLCENYYNIKYKDMISNYFSETKSFQDLQLLHNDILIQFDTLCKQIRNYNVDYYDKFEVDNILNTFCNFPEDTLKLMPDYHNIIVNAIEDGIEMFKHTTIFNEQGLPVYIIDFTDQVFLPVKLNLSIPRSINDHLSTVLVDESQDLSVMQQELIKKLNRFNNRFIFVGDEFQSIYAFNGADSKSMYKINTNFKTCKYPLSVCYRCPAKVVALAQTIVPSIESNPEREDKGILATATYDQMKNILQPGDVIIGRKNKDLLHIFMDLAFRDKIQVFFKNQDLVKTIVGEFKACCFSYINLYKSGNNIDKFVNEHMKDWMLKSGIVSVKSKYYQQEVARFREEYIRLNKSATLSKQIQKSNYTLDFLKLCMKEYKDFGAYNYDELSNLTTYYSIILDFIDIYKQTKTSPLVKDFVAYMSNYLYSSSVPEKEKGKISSKDIEKITQSVPIIGSIHSMKGGEANRVFIYDYPAFPYSFSDMSEEDMQQELNLQYVAITRAKKELYLLLLDPKSNLNNQYDTIVTMNNQLTDQVAKINKSFDENIN